MLPSNCWPHGVFLTVQNDKFLKLMYHSILSGIADNYIVRDPAGVQLFQRRPFKTDNMNSCHVKFQIKLNQLVDSLIN